MLCIIIKISYIIIIFTTWSGCVCSTQVEEWEGYEAATSVVEGDIDVPSTTREGELAAPPVREGELAAPLMREGELATAPVRERAELEPLLALAWEVVPVFVREAAVATAVREGEPTPARDNEVEAEEDWELPVKSVC